MLQLASCLSISRFDLAACAGSHQAISLQSLRRRLYKRVQDIFEDMAGGRLSSDEYPYVRQPSASTASSFGGLAQFCMHRQLALLHVSYGFCCTAVAASQHLSICLPENWCSSAAADARSVSHLQRCSRRATATRGVPRRACGRTNPVGRLVPAAVALRAQVAAARPQTRWQPPRRLSG